ncbi:MAG: NUDIX domain-containing protein [Planctomycetaceae bacterium]|nr:NUDIX domain-containing protein [Planctomycetaceae bacterium]
MRRLKSCGVILFRRHPELAFLLMKHPDRWDLPKGHVDEGETDLECALREMEEETGISRESVKIDPDFRFSEVYYPVYKRYPGEKIEKTLIIFLGWLEDCPPITHTEHTGHEWIPWNPPHIIQKNTINPLLADVAHFFDAAGNKTI